MHSLILNMDITFVKSMEIPSYLHSVLNPISLTFLRVHNKEEKMIKISVSCLLKLIKPQYLPQIDHNCPFLLHCY